MNDGNQNVVAGLVLAIVTAITWGLLPIAMKQLLTDMTPHTIVWFRFSISAVLLGIYLTYRKKIPSIKLFYKTRWLIWLIVAIIGLTGNFLLFSTGLRYLTPTASQVIGQLSPVGMLIASVLILKEKIRINQLIGAFVLIVGLLMFFNRNLIELFTQLSDFTLGIIFGGSAAIIWVCYGVAQKVLLRRLGAQQILWLLYVLIAIILVPFANINELYLLTNWQLACLFFCGVNTIIGYGALAEAMARWQASQVSAVITLTPLFTLLFSDILSILWPEMFTFQTLNLLGYIGAVLVVVGAMYSAIGHLLLKRKINI